MNDFEMNKLILKLLLKEDEILKYLKENNEVHLCYTINNNKKIVKIKINIEDFNIEDIKKEVE